MLNAQFAMLSEESFFTNDLDLGQVGNDKLTAYFLHLHFKKFSDNERC